MSLFFAFLVMTTASNRARPRAGGRRESLHNRIDGEHSRVTGVAASRQIAEKGFAGIKRHPRDDTLRLIVWQPGLHADWCAIHSPRSASSGIRTVRSHARIVAPTVITTKITASQCKEASLLANTAPAIASKPKYSTKYQLTRRDK